MNFLSTMWTLPLAALFAMIFGSASLAYGQPETRKDYPLLAKAVPTGEELSSQPNLWIMEVHFKPMRMVEVTLTNPETGKRQQENIWYLAYKAINRPLERKTDESNTTPQNEEDQEPSPSMFVPVFTLRTDDITNDMPVQEIYQDVILPEAQAAINRREGRTYQNSVEIMQAVPPATPVDEGDENAIYGVAMWRGVDRETDFFTVYMSGFSNGYRYVDGPVKFDKLREMAQNGELKPSDAVWDGAEDIRTASEVCNWNAAIKAQTNQPRPWRSAGSVGGLFEDVKSPPEDALERFWFFTKTADRYPEDKRPPVWRRTIVQHFSRFGDRFNESESEFRSCLEPRWTYWADDKEAASPLPMPASDNAADNE